MEFSFCHIDLAILTVFRPVRAVKAALDCIEKALMRNCHQGSRPRVVLVSDTPSLVNDLTPKLQQFAEVKFLCRII